MQDFRLYFVECENMEQKILGRKSKDYLFKEFDGHDYTVIKDVSQVEFNVFPMVILPLDTPLVRREHIAYLIKSMKMKGINHLSFGSEDKGFGIYLKNDKTSFFSEDVEFSKLGGAKSYNIVYNTLRKRIIQGLIDSGALLLGEEFHVDDTVVVDSGATLISPLTLKGYTHIKSGAVVENSALYDSIIDRGVSVTSSHLTASRVGENSTVGPFARLRGANIGANCRIGDFVEVKNSTLHNGVKSAHLSYIGDSEVGERTNVGCGTVFCNYDGKNKHRTTVGEGCFIGANVNLVAPLAVGDKAYIAAGTTVTKDIESGDFVIGRVRAEKGRHPKTDNSK